MSRNTSLSELINYVSASSNGNVTVAPPASGFALEVFGTGRYSGALSGSSATFTGNIGVGVSAGTEKLKVQSTGYYYTANFSTSGSSDGLSNGVLIAAGTNSSDVALNVTSQANSNLLYVRGDGNVGIGTNSPTDTIGYGRTLDIQSSTGAVVYLRDSDAPTTQYGFIAYDGNDNGLKIQNANGSGFLRFDTSGSERMRITAAGLVGIGNTSPEGKLTIQGTSAQPPTSGTTANSLLQIVGSLGGELNIGSNTVLGEYGSYIQVSDNNLAVPYSLNLQPNGGQVGIGTYNLASVGSALVVAQSGTPNISTIRRLDASNTGAGRLFFQATNSGGTVQNVGFIESGLENSSSNGYLMFASNTTERMRITAAGLVGIGTTAPGYTLDVLGDARIQGGGAVSYAVLNMLDNTSGGSNWAIFSGYPTLGDFTIRESGVANHLIITKTTGNATFSSNVYAGTDFRTDGGTVKVGAGSNNYYSQMSTAYSFPYVYSYFDSVAGSSYEGRIQFRTSSGGGSLATKMTITHSNGIGIGTTTPNAALEVYSGNFYTTTGNIVVANGNQSTNTACAGINLGNRGYFGDPNTGAASIQAISTGANWYSGTAMAFFTNPGPDVTATGYVERMRITSGGFVKASNNSSYVGSTSSYHEFNNSIAGQNNTVFRTTSSSDSYGPWIYFSNQSPNNTTNYFLAGTDSTNDKFFIYSNGSMYNKTGTYGTISDIKYKENIVDATSKLEDISKLKVRNFNFKGDSTKQLGFIAQEFEEVFPNMIDISKESGENGETYKAIKTSVLVPMLVKAIQELKSELDAANNRIQLLENK